MSNKTSKISNKDRIKALIFVIKSLLQVISEEHNIPIEDLNKLFNEYLRKSRYKKTP
jgi:hypothetical protein